MMLEAEGASIENRELPTVYIASMGQEDVCAALVQSLRNAGVAALGDIMQRGLKAQMKYADKIGARYTIVVGESEVAEQKVQVKDMREGKQFTLAFDEIVGFMQENA